jgi:hypothetical protein
MAELFNHLALKLGQERLRMLKLLKTLSWLEPKLTEKQL